MSLQPKTIRLLEYVKTLTDPEHPISKRKLLYKIISAGGFGHIRSTKDQNKLLYVLNTAIIRFDHGEEHGLDGDCFEDYKREIHYCNDPDSTKEFLSLA